jgi:hypothetical protein
VTAARLIEQLGVRSVADLARAAHEGRLQTLRGIGAVREAQLGAAAASILAAQAEAAAHPNPARSIGAAVTSMVAAQAEAAARPSLTRSVGGAAEGIVAVRGGEV